MYIQDDGMRLHIKIDRPEGEKCPLVVVIHGFTGHMEEEHITAVSGMLNEIGFATLRAEMYGHGGSDGEFRNHTLYKWLTNVLTVIDYARRLEWVTDLYLCGHSQGGLTVMLAAAMKHEVIKGLIPMSPAISIPDDAREGLLLGCRFDPNHIPEVIVSSERGWELNGNYIRVAQTIRVEEAIRKYTGPVLLIHGDQDETIPVSRSIEAKKLYTDAELVLIPGAMHCYEGHLEETATAVKRWMEKRKGETR